MNTIDEYLGIMMLGFVFAAILQLYLLRWRINNIADPLLFFAMTSSLSLGFGLYAVDSFWLYARIVFYFFCFYIGFFWALEKRETAVQPLVMRSGKRNLKLIVIICCALLLVANITVWLDSGLIILSGDPSLHKSTAYEGGFGFVRRLNWGIGVFALIAATYWYIWERSKSALFWLGLVMLISISGGSKSALLPIVFALGLYFLNPFSPASRSLKTPRLGILVYVALLATIPVASVLLIEQDSLESSLSALMQRAFFFGDILLYWSQPELRQHFSNLGVLDYLRDSLGSILGMIRLTDYATPVGNQFVQFTLPAGSDFSDSLGPNLPFYVRGELYFGAWVAPIHALLVGWVVGRIRRAFTRYRGANLLNYTLSAFAVCLFGALPIEEGLAIGQAVDFLVTYLFVYILAILISLAVEPKMTRTVVRKS